MLMLLNNIITQGKNYLLANGNAGFEFKFPPRSIS